MKKLLSEERRPGGRAKTIPDYELVVDAAHLFYTYKLTRGAIADRLHVQARKVTELLDSALANGIVTIAVHGELKKDAVLEMKLQAKYPQLVRALIVEPKAPRETADDVSNRLAAAAAAYFDELAKAYAPDLMRVAVTGGDTLLRFASAVSKLKRDNVVVTGAALIGHALLPEGHTHVSPTVVAGVLWSRCGGLPDKYRLATVSPYDSSEPGTEALGAVKKELKLIGSNTRVQAVVAEMSNLDVVFGGVGIVNAKGDAKFKDLYTMEVFLENIITPKDLYLKGARGDFAYCPYNARGERLEDLKFFITPAHFEPKLSGVNFFKKMVRDGKKVVGFAVEQVLPALEIALKAGILNVVVTDRTTAELLAGER